METWEYKEQDRLEMDFPKFHHNFCDNCGRLIESDEVKAELNHHLKGIVSITVPYLVCEDCIPEVIQYRHMIRNVSEMTKKLKEEHEWRCYYAAYDRINYGKLVSKKSEYKPYIN